MRSVADIEAEIRELPQEDLDELARRIDCLRAQRAASPAVDAWLSKARGAAAEGTTTAAIMSLTRGDE